jgi:glycosyltransferase involved in cell wall biosynthesis
MAKTMYNPRVSVIIPTYNRAHLIRRAVQSVLNQTYKDFELIVVDDASTDNTEEVLKGFNDDRLMYIRLSKNSGSSAGPRNTAIKIARGEYIAFQDSDDEWLPEKLEKQMKIFSNAMHEVGIVYTDMWRIRENGKKEYFNSPRIMPEEGIIYKEALDYRVICIGTSTAIIKKECFTRVGLFDDKLRMYIDTELIIRISKYYYLYHIAEPLVHYFATANSISSSKRAATMAMKLILEKHFDEISKDKKLLARHYIGIGNSLCVSGEIEEGTAYFAEALKTYPNIIEDAKLLSKYYLGLGFRLCSDGELKKGRTYLLKALKQNPFDCRPLAIIFISIFGKEILNIAEKSTRRIRDQ